MLPKKQSDILLREIGLKVFYHIISDVDSFVYVAIFQHPCSANGKELQLLL